MAKHIQAICWQIVNNLLALKGLKLDNFLGNSDLFSMKQLSILKGNVGLIRNRWYFT